MQRFIIAGLLAVLCAIIHLWAYSSLVGERLEYLATDLWHVVRGPIKPPPDVAIVSIDEQAYTAFELPLNKPWPRKLHADLVRRLGELGAKKVVFDVLFFDADPDPKVDDDLAEAFTHVPVVLGVDVGEHDRAGESSLVSLSTVQKPLKKLAEKASILALVKSPEDEGYIRRFYGGQGMVTQGYQTLSQAAADVAWDDPTLPKDRDLISFYGPAGTIPTISIDEIMHSPTPAMQKRIQGKVVFIGLTLRTEFGAAQKDSYQTPFTSKGRIFGVEIHATCAANLLTKSWIHRSSHAFEALILSLIALIVTFFVFVLRPHWAGLLTIGSMLGWCIFAYMSFLSGKLIPGAVLCLLLPFAYLGSTLYYYFTTRKSQLQTKRAFEYYLSPEMAEEVAKNPKAIALGGEGAYATAVFTDVENFTSITEKMLPEQVAEMLNSYFTDVMEVIFSSQGTLIKFIGDAVFALWGAPLKLADHASKACQAAIQMQREADKFNSTGRFPALKTRIGIHTGPMVVGNLGSKRRFDFTAIGDTVNLAARLEGINKFLGTSIVVTESVIREQKGVVPSLYMGSMQVSGKNEIIGIHTIFAEPLANSISEKWLAAIREFKIRKWEEAKKLFLEVQSESDFLRKAATLYIAQIEEFRKIDVPSSWEGTITFSAK